MSVRFSRLSALALASAFAFAALLHAAPKEWKGDNSGNGNANENDKWVDGAAPGNSDHAKLSNGKMTVNVPLQFLTLEFTGGTIDGTASLTLSQAGSVWTGGEMTTATVAMTGLSIGTGAEKKLNGGAKLNLSGTTAWTADQIGTGDSAEITNLGTFSTDFDGVMAHNQGGTRATFKNKGTFTKTSTTASGTTEIQAVFENNEAASALNVSSGILKLSGGGSSSKAVSIGNNSKLHISGNDFTFTGGALNATGTGAIDIESNIATFGGTTGSAHLSVRGSGTAKIDGSHATTGKLTLSGGKIDGTNTSSTATVGTFDWTGGDITTAAVVSGGTTIGSGSLKQIKGGAKLELSGTTTWTADQIGTGDSAEITNLGSFSTDFDGVIAHNQGGTRATFKNKGAFTKTSTTVSGTTEIQAAFENNETASTLNIDSGDLKLSGGGSSSKAVNIGNNSKLRISGNDFSFTGGTLNATGTGAIDIDSNIATFGGTTGSAHLSVRGSGTAKIDGSHATTGKLTLSGGKIDGLSTSSTATVGTLEWTGGDITTAKIVSSNATISSGSLKQIKGGAKLELSGTTAWTADQIGTGDSAEITNLGTFSTDFDGVMAHNQGGTRATFKNKGTFTKTSTTASGTTEIQAAFQNNETASALNVSSGILKLSGGGSSSKAVNLGNNSKLHISGNDFTFTGGALNATGTGAIDIDSNIATFGGTTGSAHLSVRGSGTAKIDGSHATTGKLTLSGGKIDGTNTSSTATVGTFDWTGGDITTAAVVSGGTTIGSGSLKQIKGGAKLELSGTTTWTADQIGTGDSAEITNLGTFSTNFDGVIAHNQGGTRATFKNKGAFTKTSTTASGTTEIQAAFENNETGSILNIDSGILKLSGGGSSSKAINLGNNAKLHLSGNNFSFAGGSLNTTGTGEIDIDSNIATFSGTTGTAHLTVRGSGVAKINGSHATSGKLTLAGGGKLDGLDANSSASVGSLEWTGGDIATATIASGGTTIGAGSLKQIKGGAKLNLSGTTTWTGDQIGTGDGAEITNAGSFSTNFDGVMAHNQGGTRAKFKNNGSFSKTSTTATGTTQIEANFENTGASSEVQVNSGKLRLTGGGKNANHAKIDVAANAQLEIDGDFTLESLSQLKGNGLTRFLNGVLEASGTVEIANFDFDGGQLKGSNTFKGTVNWNSGHWSSTTTDYTTTIATGATLHLRNANGHAFDRRDIVNEGIVEWHAGNITSSGGSFLNAAVFNDKHGANHTLSDGTASFTNNAYYFKTGHGTTTIGVPFVNNNGAIFVSHGTLHFTSTFHQSAGTLSIANGAVAKFDQTLSFAAGVLTGSGTIEGNVINAGLLNPGSSPGTFAIAGNLELVSTSVALFELGGTSAGTNYDVINVSGNAVLGGSLSLKFVNDFHTTVLPSSTFTVLTAANLTGAFSNVANGQRLDVFGGLGSFQVNYGLTSTFGINSVVLSNFVPVPEPSTWALLLTGLAAIALLARRRFK